MQHTVKSKAMRYESTFVVIVTRTVSHFPILGGLQSCTDSSRVRYTILEQVARHSGTAKAIAIIEPEGPLEHFVLTQLRRQACVKFTAPAKALGKVITPVSEFRELNLVRVFSKLVVNAVTRIDCKQVIRQNLESERRRNIRELQRISRKVIRHAVASCQQTTRTILVFHRLRRVTLGRIGSMPHHLQILDIKVIAQTKANCFLFNLVRVLSQQRMRCELFHGIDFWCVRIRNTRRKHMPYTRKATDFWHPNTIQLGIGSNTVIVVVRHLTIFIVFRVKAHVTLAVFERIFWVNPTRSGPISSKRCTRRNVDDIEQRARIIQRERACVTYILCRRIHSVHSIAGALGVVIKAVVKVVVELFQIAHERAVFVRFFVFTHFEIKELSVHAVLNVRNFTFHHVSHQVMVLASFNCQALVRSKAS